MFIQVIQGKVADADGLRAAMDRWGTDLQPGARVAYGGEGTGHGESILTGRNLVARVPDTVPFDQACFATLGSVAMNAEVPMSSTRGPPAPGAPMLCGVACAAPPKRERSSSLPCPAGITA
jgi:hypothetical protein